MKLEKKFIEFCSSKKLEINSNQIKIINSLEKFQNDNFDNSFLSSFFKKESKLGFYLHGDVGVGKTMILDFFFKQFEIKKAKILFFDEFQVTNIVDAMILGRLFEKIFEKKICVLFSSNIKINDLYEDGLQRDQFLPFLKILKENSIEKELSINEDYRINKKDTLNRFLSPLNETTNFKLNKFFRELTKHKTNNPKKLDIKGRELVINNFYEGIAKFKFDELCDKNLGAEDYLQISNCCN